MKNFVNCLVIAILFTTIGWFANVAWNLPSNSNPISQIKPRPLDKYSIENLSKSKIVPVPIEIVKILKEEVNFTSYEFKFTFDPALTSSSKKTVTGMLNIPKGTGPFPIILMLRGFVDAKTYFIGQGTQRASEFFAKNGYITIAPDFLGYGDSDEQPDDVFESRFQTYTTVLTLLKSLDEHIITQPFNYSTIGIWGHSNGGQIALAILEITQGPYPTVLWAPVSKPFPYSILFFTDSPGDYGKSLRLELAKFEENYDTDLYSIHKYFDRIKAPIELNQGTADPNVPKSWSDELNKTLSDMNVDISYKVYQGSDHNMQPNWSPVVQSNLIFFNKHLTQN